MPNEQLLAYLKSELARGVKREDLVRVLQSAGWKDDAIMEAFESMGPPPPPPQAPQTTPQAREPDETETEQPASNMTVVREAYHGATQAQPSETSGTVHTTTSRSRKAWGYVGGIFLLLVVIVSVYVGYTQIPASAPQPTATTVATTTTSTPPPPPSPALAATPFANTTFGYVITSPAGWKTASSSDDTVVTFTNPTEDSVTVNGNLATSTAKTSVWVSAPASGTTAQAELDAYMQAKIAQLQKDLTSFQLLSNATTTVGTNAPARTILVSWQDKNGATNQMLEMDTVGNTRVYEISAIAVAQSWNTYGPLFQAVINSFAFSN